MTDQLALAALDLKPSLELKLTPNQQLAWDYVRERDGVTADEVGALIHSQPDRRRSHGVDERCDWCARDGRQVLASKAVKPLVTYKRNAGHAGKLGRVYVVRNGDDRVRPEPAEPHDCPQCHGELTVSGLVCTTCHGNPFFGL